MFSCSMFPLPFMFKTKLSQDVNSKTKVVFKVTKQLSFSSSSTHRISSPLLLFLQLPPSLLTFDPKPPKSVLAQFQAGVPHFPSGILFHANSLCFVSEIRKHLAETC